MKLSLSVLALLALRSVSSISATLITASPSKTAVLAGRQFSSASLASCSTVSGLASPQPSGAVCGELANSDGTGYLISYVAGSPYVASLAALSGFAKPQPANTTCGVLAFSNGSGTIIDYTNGVYTENAATCGQICLATTGCTNVYFEAGAYCNLHSGPPTNLASSSSPYTFYDLSCFTCQDVIYSSSSSSTSTQTSILSTAQSSTVSSTSSVTTSVTSSITPISSESSTTPTTTASWTWTSVQTNPALYNMALTTTYTQSPQCTTGAITEMAAWGPYLWDNSVNPLPTSTMTTCYPPQFYSSVIGILNNVTLPAFSALVCPYEWDTIPYNASYIACCPNGFGLIAPNYASNSARPFSGALCTSNIGFGQVYDVSSYNSTAYWTVIPVTATAGTVVFADAFDGITAPATTSTLLITSSSTKSSSFTKSSASTTATTSIKA
ncbi:uncharacterized protein LY89DRAFT_750091 [Mollisia scopiformis]|uniref:Apple domain-containing protein n=1 Tax=Mollisia scopiformis TaxID=149040 RepID=A0A194X856_MOLSC|nr:uncharacterized protein LY89DRAFT_750091 [Mollisia scopiformis]KUJ15982.1 hypothetical protein LY89DRAFT_750091 [Mollisia scopiformis]